jgi:hypothetical protein
MTNLNHTLTEEKKKNQKIKLPKFTDFFSFSNKAAYERFIRETGRKDITYKEFIAIPKAVNKSIREKIASGLYAVRFPKFGLLKVIGTVPYSSQSDKPGRIKTRPDWAHYNKTKEMRRVPVGDMDGKVYRAYFYPYYRQFPVLGFFTFKTGLELRQLITKNALSNKMAK